MAYVPPAFVQYTFVGQPVNSDTVAANIRGQIQTTANVLWAQVAAANNGWTPAQLNVPAGPLAVAGVTYVDGVTYNARNGTLVTLFVATTAMMDFPKFYSSRRFALETDAVFEDETKARRWLSANCTHTVLAEIRLLG
ncbi:hypothetical protein B0H17DRAFT_1136436 [Mycena rosella]|uniref:Uncharacterized protein n=1 Tax=Mycena rosella TaxID=1033263 RepID=A0AAD7GEE5_MYCRO|nr:hypothetical protein B0H17DRAFT_1136436 [Mycena rosella]